MVLIWIYFESQREKDRNERRAARPADHRAYRPQLGDLRNQYESLEQKFDAQMSVLLSMIKDQGQAQRKQGGRSTTSSGPSTTSTCVSQWSKPPKRIAANLSRNPSAERAKLTHAEPDVRQQSLVSRPRKIGLRVASRPGQRLRLDPKKGNRSTVWKIPHALLERSTLYLHCVRIDCAKVHAEIEASIDEPMVPITNFRRFMKHAREMYEKVSTRASIGSWRIRTTFPATATST